MVFLSFISPPTQVQSSSARDVVQSACPYLVFPNKRLPSGATGEAHWVGHLPVARAEARPARLASKVARTSLRHARATSEGIHVGPNYLDSKREGSIHLSTFRPAHLPNKVLQ